MLTACEARATTIEEKLSEGFAVSRKRKRNQPKPKKPLGPAQFALGSQVRVKPGTADPDYTDIPLGGWSGTIVDVEEGRQGRTYLVEWDQRTLAAQHPVYLRRCDRDGAEPDCTWLGENDLAPDTGEPAPIEQPAQIITRPLNRRDQEDRVRMALGLTSDDPLPDVNEQNLRKYHRYLAEKLTLPFPADHEEESGPFRVRMYRVAVTALLDADEGDVDDGLLCAIQEDGESVVVPLAEIEARSNPHRQLVTDYCFWFWNWPAGSRPDGVPERSRPEVVSAVSGGLSDLVINILCGGLYGAVLGAGLEVLDGAGVAIKVGAALLGLIGAIMGASSGPSVAVLNGNRPGRWLFALSIAVVAAAVGALLGVIVIAFLGALIGFVAGGFLGALAGKLVRLAPLAGLLLGPMLGVLVQAWMQDATAAWYGAWVGAICGAVGGPVLVYGTSLILAFLPAHRA